MKQAEKIKANSTEILSMKLKVRALEGDRLDYLSLISNLYYVGAIGGCLLFGVGLGMDLIAERLQLKLNLGFGSGQFIICLIGTFIMIFSWVKAKKYCAEIERLIHDSKQRL